MKFSKMSEPKQQQVIDIVNRRWGQLYELEKEWGERVYKYLLLANSGGAVAMLSFLGTGKATHVMASQMALVAFVLGVIITGCGLARIYHRMEGLLSKYKRDVRQFFADEIDYGEVLQRDESRSDKEPIMAYILPYAAFGLFIGGCAVAAYGLFGSVVQPA